MDIFEEARSIKGMLALRGMTQNQLAEMLGVSQPYIANKLRLLRLPVEIQEQMSRAKISERHARTLLRLPVELIEEALGDVIRGGMTTQETEIMVDRILEEQKEAEGEGEALGLKEGIEGYTERLQHLILDIEKRLLAIRVFGTPTKMKEEKFGDKIYISICIG